MGDMADDALRQAQDEFEEFELHDLGRCQGPGEDDGCPYCNDPAFFDRLKRLTPTYPC